MCHGKESKLCMKERGNEEILLLIIAPVRSILERCSQFGVMYYTLQPL